MLKTVVLLKMFVETGYFFQDYLINMLKKQHLFEIKAFILDIIY